MSAKPLESAALEGLYDQDFALWCDETARLLRAGGFAQVDVENLIEEVEAMAGSQRREVRSRLTQRRELRLLFEQSPSLRSALAPSVGRAYADAVKDAARETGLPASSFPSECRYRPDQIIDDDFWPGQG